MSLTITSSSHCTLNQQSAVRESHPVGYPLITLSEVLIRDCCVPYRFTFAGYSSRTRYMFWRWNSPLALIVLACSLPTLSLAQLSNTSAIGNGKQFSCWNTAQGNLLLHHRRNGLIVNISFESGRKRLLRQVKSLTNKLRESKRSHTNQRRLRKRLANVQRAINDLSRCEGGADSMDTSPAAVDACSIATIQRSSPVQKHSSNPGYSRIIDGNTCDSRYSATVRVLLLGRNYSTIGSCSGTVIDRRLVITAAHCLQADVHAVEVIAGSHRSRTSSFYAHTGYNPYIGSLEQNDIGIIRTYGSLPVTPVPILTSLDSSYEKTTTVIGGYGLTEANTAGKLKAATVRINTISPHTISIRYSGTGQHGNTCFGDSGGPIFVSFAGRWYLAGVTSNGIRHDCGAGDISNFANLSHRTNRQFIQAWKNL
jgi:hypothetical protein